MDFTPFDLKQIMAQDGRSNTGMICAFHQIEDRAGDLEIDETLL
jgi:hypothetical protein